LNETYFERGQVGGVIGYRRLNDKGANPGLTLSHLCFDIIIIIIIIIITAFRFHHSTWTVNKQPSYVLLLSSGIYLFVWFVMVGRLKLVKGESHGQSSPLPQAPIFYSMLMAFVSVSKSMALDQQYV